jgi:hypothetical protein
MQAFRLMPTRIVENKQNAFSWARGHLRGHRINKDLKNRRVAMRDDQTHQLAGRGIDRSDDVLPDMTP